MMAKIIAVRRLTHVYAHKHGHGKNISIYIQGKRKIDYCIISPKIIDHVILCNFETFHARMGSDHQRYFADLSMEGLFDRHLPPIVNPRQRIRNSHSY